MFLDLQARWWVGTSGHATVHRTDDWDPTTCTLAVVLANPAAAQLDDGFRTQGGHPVQNWYRPTNQDSKVSYHRTRCCFLEVQPEHGAEWYLDHQETREAH